MTRRVVVPRSRLIQKIHVAKRQLGLAEADYRSVLISATGKDSSGAMSEPELHKAIEAFEALGFKQTFKGAPDGKKSPRAGIRLVFGLWTELGRKELVENASRPALFAFVKRMTGVEHPDWLDNAQAGKVVEALKAIRDRGQSKPKPDGAQT